MSILNFAIEHPALAILAAVGIGIVFALMVEKQP